MEPKTERRNFKLFGELHPNAKLTRSQVVEIRREAEVPETSRAWLAQNHGEVCENSADLNCKQYPWAWLALQEVV